MLSVHFKREEDEEDVDHDQDERVKRYIDINIYIKYIKKLPKMFEVNFANVNSQTHTHTHTHTQIHTVCQVE